MRPTLTRWILMMVAAAATLLLGAEYSSPLTGLTGVDYDIFIDGGQALLRGELFDTFFDNKGPYLFAINALGWWLSPSKWGIFILEILNLTVTLELLYRVGTALRCRRGLIVGSLAFFLLSFFPAAFYGDSVEGWSLIPAALPMLLALRWQKGGGDNARSTLWLQFAAGVCFGVIAMLRINNAAIPLGVAAAVVAYLLNRRRFGLAARAALVAVAGIVVGMAPALIYFGAMGTLDEMIYANFIHNLKYYSHYKNQPSWVVLYCAWLMIGCIVAPIASLRHRQLTAPGRLVVVAISVATFLAFLVGRPVLHYFILVIPVSTLALLLLDGLKQRWIVWLIAVAMLVPYYYDAQVEVADRLSRPILLMQGGEKADSLLHFTDDIAARVFAVIPEEERTSVYQLELPREHWGLMCLNGYSAVGKYHSQQLFVAAVGGELRGRDVQESFRQASPLWVAAGEPFEETFLGNFADGYELVDSVPRASRGITIYLYRRR